MFIYLKKLVVEPVFCVLVEKHKGLYKAVVEPTGDRNCAVEKLLKERKKKK